MNLFVKVAKCVVLFLILPLAVLANPVDEAEAQQRAKVFLKQRGITKSLNAMRTTARGRRAPGSSITSPAYYIFNVGTTDGFVIVSGDDRTVDILGYADSGSIEDSLMPDGMRYMLDCYAKEMEWLDKNGLEENTASNRMRKTAPSYAPIAPLIETEWNQGAPYNKYCPIIDEEYTVTGCVATTMAQLMYYFKYPTEACTDLPDYSYTALHKNKESFTNTVEGLSSTTFQWGDMALTYTTSSTGTAADAVAKLMHYCGVSLQMRYGLNANGGSSAYGEAIATALKSNFGYDGGIRNTYRKNYNYDEWVSLIYSELAADRPVALGGQSAGGGHSFICDGYERGDYFHINWGWGGKSNGNFRLSILQPWAQGIGGSSTLDGFSFGQSAVIGIQTPVGGNKDYCMSLEGFRFTSPDAARTSKTYSRDGEGAFADINLYVDVYNYYHGSNAFDVALHLVDEEDNLKQSLGYQETGSLSWNGHLSQDFSLSIPSSVKDGTYYIKVMSRPHGTTDWQECFDGDRYMLEAVISDNTLTITVPIPLKVNPSSVSISLTGGDKVRGYEQQVTATITAGSNAYHDDVILRVDGVAVMGQTVDVPAGETVSATFTFVPKTDGNITLSLWNSRSAGTQIGSDTEIKIYGNREEVDITLLGRTFYKDGAWNTMCLPFSLTGEQLAASPFADATIMELDTEGTYETDKQTGYDDSTNKLRLYFKNASTIEAGKPYIIKWTRAGDYVNDNEHNCYSPVFNDVTVDNSLNPVESKDGKVNFKVTYYTTALANENKTVLFVGNNNTLYYPLTGASIGAQHAYFKLLDGISFVKEIVLDFEEDDADGIGEIQNSKFKIQNEADVVYDLSGRIVNSQLKKGIYINNGKKIFVK